jgi:hypothetical protein
MNRTNDDWIRGDMVLRAVFEDAVEEKSSTVEYRNRGTYATSSVIISHERPAGPILSIEVQRATEP